MNIDEMDHITMEKQNFPQKLLDEETRFEFENSLKRVAITNFLIFLIILTFLVELSPIYGILSRSLFYHFAIPALFLIDLFFTIIFLKQIYSLNENEPNYLYITIFGISSGMTRLLPFVQYFISNILNLSFILVPFSGFMFGWLLFFGLKDIHLPYVEMLLGIAIINLIGIFGLPFSSLRFTITGIKLFTILPASLVYLMISSNLIGYIRKLENGKKEDSQITNVQEINKKVSDN